MLEYRNDGRVKDILSLDTKPEAYRKTFKILTPRVSRSICHESCKFLNFRAFSVL